MNMPNYYGYFPDTVEQEESVESWLDSTAETLLKGEAVKVGRESWVLSDAIATIDGDYLAGKLSVLYNAVDKREATYDLFENALRPAARIVAAKILPRLVAYEGRK
jgi:hypothetical protein